MIDYVTGDEAEVFGLRAVAEASAEGSGKVPGRICPPPQPVFPSEQIQCDGECGFTRAGFGWRCNEGNACGRFINRGEPGCAELTAYYDAAAKAAEQETEVTT